MDPRPDRRTRSRAIYPGHRCDHLQRASRTATNRTGPATRAHRVFPPSSSTSSRTLLDLLEISLATTDGEPRYDDRTLLTVPPPHVRQSTPVAVIARALT